MTAAAWRRGWSGRRAPLPGPGGPATGIAHVCNEHNQTLQPAAPLYPSPHSSVGSQSPASAATPARRPASSPPAAGAGGGGAPARAWASAKCSKAVRTWREKGERRVEGAGPGPHVCGPPRASRLPFPPTLNPSQPPVSATHDELVVKGEGGQGVEGKPARVSRVVSARHGGRGPGRQQPRKGYGDAPPPGVALGVAKGADLGQGHASVGDIKPGLLAQLPRRRVPQGLVHVDKPAREGPTASSGRAGPLDEEQAGRGGGRVDERDVNRHPGAGPLIGVGRRGGVAGGGGDGAGGAHCCGAARGRRAGSGGGAGGRRGARCVLSPCSGRSAGVR